MTAIDLSGATMSLYVDADLWATLIEPPAATAVFVHGSAYRNHGCRCAVCRAWQREQQRKYRAKRAA